MNIMEFFESVKNKTKNTIGIDFDGVIHRYSKEFLDGTLYDVPSDGTEEALKYLFDKKYNLIIFTCRADPDRPLVNGKTGTELIWDWLKKYKLDEYISKVTYVKPRALFYIDDKGIRFESWKQTLEFLKGRI